MVYTLFYILPFTHYSVCTGDAATPTGVVPGPQVDAGSYLHPPGHEEPMDNLPPRDRGSYLEVIDSGVYLHAPPDELAIEGML